MFVFNNGIVKPEAETLGTFPFSVMWERDDSPNKDQAHLEFKFIYFFCSPKKSNPFYGYDRIKNRGDKILENIVKQYPNFRLGTLIRDGIEQYDEFWNNASPKLSYYNSAKAAVKKLEDFLNTFDMTATNLRTGAPIYKPKDITSALTDTGNVVKSLATLEETVYQEIYESSKSKGNREINYFEE